MRSIDPVLLSKIKEQNQTIWNNAQPKMSVTVSRAKSTVTDSTYWTVETIREKEGLGDISVAPRRFKAYGTPNRIYEIHIDNGIVGTAIREYPDKMKIGWQNQFTLGQGNKVAIAFDGEWHRHRKLWRLVTHEKPWIFWIDGSGNLQTQHWDDNTTKLKLASGVIFIKAIRGWKNLNMADKDQGIIIGYIKSDGKVYYRNYCQALDLSYSWEVERQVAEFTGTAVSLNLFLTNDYRMGFVVEDNVGDIYWYITDRDWAGMAIAPEFIKASVGGDIELIPIEKINAYNTEYISASVGGDIQLLYTLADNSIKHIENVPITMTNEDDEEYQNYGFKVYIKVRNDLTNIDYMNFSLKDENNTIFNMTGVTKIGKKEYLFNTADFNNAVGDLILTFAGSGNTKGEAGQNLDSFSDVFIPENLVPTFVPLPEVTEVWNE